MSAVAVNRITHSFSNSRKGPKVLKVLDNVSLRVGEGQVHVLLGLSGSGKSTLLRIVMGLLPADSGSVSIGKEKLGTTPTQIWLRAIGYVPQDGGLFPHLSARENVALVARVSGWDAHRIEARITELLQLVSLDASILGRYPRELSGGQKQRVALMRAVFLDPQLLILDEPLGALDPILRSDLQAELKQVFTRLRKTVLLVTHDLGEAAYLGDQVTLLSEGRVLQTGSIHDLLERPSDPYVTRFVSAQRTLGLRA